MSSSSTSSEGNWHNANLRNAMDHFEECWYRVRRNGFRAALEALYDPIRDYTDTDDICPMPADTVANIIRRLRDAPLARAIEFRAMFQNCDTRRLRDALHVLIQSRIFSFLDLQDGVSAADARLIELVFYEYLIDEPHLAPSDSRTDFLLCLFTPSPDSLLPDSFIPAVIYHLLLENSLTTATRFLEASTYHQDLFYSVFDTTIMITQHRIFQFTPYVRETQALWEALEDRRLDDPPAVVAQLNNAMPHLAVLASLPRLDLRNPTDLQAWVDQTVAQHTPTTPLREEVVEHIVRTFLRTSTSSTSTAILGLTAHLPWELVGALFATLDRPPSRRPRPRLTATPRPRGGSHHRPIPPQRVRIQPPRLPRATAVQQ
jgi:hypothetical protein